MLSGYITVCFIVAIIFPPILCSVLAAIDKRNKIRWFFYGLFFGIFAIIYLVFYTKRGDNDKIAPRTLVLLGCLMALMLLSIYEAFFGLLLGWNERELHNFINSFLVLCWGMLSLFCYKNSKIQRIGNETMDFLCNIF